MFLFIGLVSLLFAVHPQYGATLQIVGVSFFILEGFIAFAGIAVLSKTTSGKYSLKIDFDTLLICIVLPYTSIIALVMNNRTELILQTVLFTICALSARAIIIRKGVDAIFYIIVYLSCTLVIITFVFESGSLLDGLKLVANEVSGRVRYTPFGNHPNLTAHIFGVAFLSCMVYLIWFFKNKAALWYLALFSAVAGVAMISSTSSRGGTVAICCALMSVYFAHILKGSNNFRSIMVNIIWGSVGIFALMMIANIEFGKYITNLFELNSEYRGLDSGLTGRSDNWPIIVALSIKSFGGIVFGHGIRSWDGSMLDIATDSSYVNSLWESGIFLTATLIILICRKIYLLIKVERSFVSDFYLAILVFAAVESIVARYLIGIGNPGSLIFLIILLTPESMWKSKGSSTFQVG